MSKFPLSKYDLKITAGLVGGTVGAAGWILGAAEALVYAPAGSVGMADVLVVLGCGLGVVLTGGVVWWLYLCRRRLNSFIVCEVLLGASAVFGTLAVAWMQIRGVLGFALGPEAGLGQPGNEIWVALGRRVPQELAYAVPLLLAGMMAALSWPPLRGLLIAGRTHVQRDPGNSVAA